MTDAGYLPGEEAATPEYVLAVFRDEHRQQCQYDCAADPYVSLSFATSVRDWRLACDLVGSRVLGRALNHMWKIECTGAEWRAVLRPEGERTLADVCRLIASRAHRARIRPVSTLGCDGKSAGAFLTVRALLQQAGAAAEAISPSTPLAGYTRTYFEVFLLQIARLAPGALPPVRVRTPIYVLSVWMLAASILVLIVGINISLLSGEHLLTIGSGVAFLLSYFLNRIASKLRSASVEFGDLRTFRDLAIRLAEHA
jgi:hypothetical protein